MTKTFIDKYDSEIRSLEQEAANDLDDILGRPIKYESKLIHPSDPQSNSDKCKLIIEFRFDPEGGIE